MRKKSERGRVAGKGGWGGEEEEGNGEAQMRESTGVSIFMNGEKKSQKQRGKMRRKRREKR